MIVITQVGPLHPSFSVRLLPYLFVISLIFCFMQTPQLLLERINKATCIKLKNYINILDNVDKNFKKS